MEKDITKNYTNGEVTIVWKPSQCIHSKICWTNNGLPEVFNPREKPWIKPEGAPTEKMVEQVKKCPSGALSFYYNNQKPEDANVPPPQTKIEAAPNGPLLVHGNIVIKDAAGNETSKTNVTALCRCGHSQNKPYCDSNHTKKGFIG